jgi:predicted RNA-binding Zn ribbon-like protein
MDRDWLALDFLMTGGLTPTRSEFEQLHSEGDLDNWLLTTFDADSHLAATHEDLAQAIELREAIFLTIRANTEDRVPSNDHLTRINAVAAETPLTPVFEAGPAGHRWQAPIRPAAALSTIARDAIDLLTGPTASRVRECANPKCELVFVDLSPPGARRWCAMQRCGNRSKTKAYRARRQT